jgi:nucleotide-binding universal stress UspA family protein
MYDEFERALTGKTPRKGPTSFGWALIGLGLVLVAGVVGVGYGVHQVTKRVKHVAREMNGASVVATARVVSHLERSTSVVALDPEDGLSFLRSLGSGDPAQALVQKVVGGQLDLPESVQGPQDGARGGDVSSTTIHSDDGDVSFHLTRGKNGGSLVIDSKDGHVRFDLTKSPNGGTLTIDSDDGHARFDLIKGDDGGRLVIHSDDGTVELSVGAQSRSAPGWVPRPSAMPSETRPVFSLTTPEKTLGAVTWEDDASPGEWVAGYRTTLEKAGYEVQVEHSRSGPDGEEASLWARRDRDARTVFVLARRLDGRTHEVLGYGEGNVPGR